MLFAGLGIDPDATRFDDDCGGTEDVHEDLLRQHRLVIAFGHNRNPLAGVLDPGFVGAGERADGWAEIYLIRGQSRLAGEGDRPIQQQPSVGDRRCLPWPAPRFFVLAINKHAKLHIAARRMEKDRIDKLTEDDRIGEPSRDLVGHIVALTRPDFRDDVAEPVE